MTLITFDTWYYFLVNAIYIGFCIFTIFGLLFRWLGRGNVHREAINIQASANFALAFGAVLSLVFWIMLFWAYRGPSSNWDDNEYVQTSYQFNFSTDWWVIPTGLVILIGLSFFFRRPRRSWVLSLLALLFINYEYMVEWLGISNDEWAAMDMPLDLLFWELLAFSGICFLLYFWQAKRKKLPYDSAWIHK